MGWPGATEFRIRDGEPWVPIAIRRKQPSPRPSKQGQVALLLLVT